MPLTAILAAAGDNVGTDKLPIGETALSWGILVRLIRLAGIFALLVWLLPGCASGRPTSLVRAPDGHEVLVAHCETWSVVCQSVRVTGDPRDEEAWGIHATGVSRSKAGAAWARPGVYYSVGDRARCDEVRAAMSRSGTSSQECWGPTYFRRE